jgi:hypothetical protein
MNKETPAAKNARIIAAKIKREQAKIERQAEKDLDRALRKARKASKRDLE